jgi:ketosteroid isomerase-like protein
VKNVERARLLIDAYNRGDVDAAAPHWHEDGVWHPAITELADRAGFRGIDGLRRYWEELADWAAETRIDLTDVRELSDEHVVVHGLFTVEFRSGVRMEQKGYGLLVFRDGKCIESWAWFTWDEALKALTSLGLSAHVDGAGP